MKVIKQKLSDVQKIILFKALLLQKKLKLMSQAGLES